LRKVLGKKHRLTQRPVRLPPGMQTDLSAS
jgi:hypothetical protein